MVSQRKKRTRYHETVTDPTGYWTIEALEKVGKEKWKELRGEGIGRSRTEETD